MSNTDYIRQVKNPLYRTWYNMLYRCTVKNNRKHRYQDRGINVCDRWQSFERFVDDMGTSYSSGMSLERTNNNLGYTPENCRWATAKEQANNRSTNRFITHNGITMTIAQWATYANVKSSTFRQRFYVYKWPFEKCLIK